MKIYFYRHQAAGILYECPFSATPGGDDLEYLRAIMLARHGDKHPKTGETYWDKIVEVEVFSPGTFRETVEAAGDKTPPKAAAPEFKVRGTGEVK